MLQTTGAAILLAASASPQGGVDGGFATGLPGQWRTQLRVSLERVLTGTTETTLPPGMPAPILDIGTGAVAPMPAPPEPAELVGSAFRYAKALAIPLNPEAEKVVAQAVAANTQTGRKRRLRRK